MGKMVIGGGGIQLEDVTATQPDVLQGKTAYMKGGDEPAGGTMPNKGAWTGRVSVNGRVAIPAGYHNGSGYVDQSIPTQGGKTVTPGASQQTVVAAGRYVTGDVVVPGFALPAANTIKKGTTINIYGRTVIGTFEGWVPSPQDLYYNGVNSSALEILETSWEKQNTRLYCYSGRPNGEWCFGCTKQLDVRQYSRLIIEGYFTTALASPVVRNFPDPVSGIKYAPFNNGATKISMDISQAAIIPMNTLFGFSSILAGSYITRIRLE